MGTLTFIIILGIISSIFGKIRANNPKTRKKPFSINNVDDLRGLFTNKPAQNQAVKQPTEFTLEKIEKKYRRIGQEKVVELPVMVPEEVVKTEEVHTPVKVTSDRPKVPSEADRIINGIVWSEILGEPRAKKSYFSSKR